MNGPIVPVFQTGLYIEAGTLERRGGEVLPGGIGPDVLCGYQSLFLIPGRGCDAPSSPRDNTRSHHRASRASALPMLNEPGLLFPQDRRDQRPSPYRRPDSRHSGRARVAFRQSAPRAHPTHRPAGTALRGGGVSRESRVHPSRTCSTGRDTSIGRGPFANCDVSRSTPEAAVHPASSLTMIRQGVPSPHRLVSSRAKNPIRS